MILENDFLEQISNLSHNLIHNKLQQKRFESSDQILRIIDNSFEHISKSKLENNDSIKNAELLYGRLKYLYDALPHSKGKGIAHHQLMAIYKIIVDKTKKDASGDFNSKTEFIVNFVDKGNKLIEKNELGNAMRCYAQASNLFSELPEDAMFGFKKSNIQPHLKLLYDKILFSSEINRDVRLCRNIHSLEILLGRCEKLASCDKENARKIYLHILTLLSSFEEAPANMLMPLSEIKQRINSLKFLSDIQSYQSTLENFTKYAPSNEEMPLTNKITLPNKETNKNKASYFVEPTMSDELISLIASTHNLKSQEGFLELANLFYEIESSEAENLSEARQKFDHAKKILIKLNGNKEAANKCLIKIRERLELMAYFEKMNFIKDKGEIKAALSELQRKTFDYNLNFPNDCAFSDKIYEKCASLCSLLDEGLAGEKGL